MATKEYHQQQHAMHREEMRKLVDQASAANRNLTSAEIESFDWHENQVKTHERYLRNGSASAEAERLVAGQRGYVPDTRGSAHVRESASVEGRANEAVRPGQVREWFDKAQRNDVGFTTGSRESGYRPVSLASQGTDRDLNRYWAERMGVVRGSVETRTLGEDTSSGSGAAQAITPQSWIADYVDVLLPNTILGKVGAHVVPMSTEYVNVPVFSSTVSPSWIAEAGSISLDANPAFSSLQLIATGGFKDITLYSLEAAQDAYIRGDLDGMLAQAVAKKMQVVLDTSTLLGVADNAGIPGLVNESGFVTRHYTGDSGTSGTTPTDTTELAVVVQNIMKKNVSPNAFVSNVGVNQAFESIPVSDFGKYWDNPSIAQSCVDNWVTSENSALPYTETDPSTASSVAQTAGTMSSLYAGPWDQFCIVGMHLDLQTTVLKERYVDSGEVGLFSFCRYSVRFAHPETFSRTIGIIT